ncbi:hypothetical protein Hanom_Chr04g00345631 [Helianthus anomalus]
MGRGLERWLGTNVTTPGGLRFRRGPLGGGFSPGIGRGYPHDMAEPHWPRALALRNCFFFPRHPSHVPPYPFEIGFWS